MKTTDDDENLRLGVDKIAMEAIDKLLKRGYRSGDVFEVMTQMKKKSESDKKESNDRTH